MRTTSFFGPALAWNILNTMYKHSTFENKPNTGIFFPHTPCPFDCDGYNYIPVFPLVPLIEGGKAPWNGQPPQLDVDPRKSSGGLLPLLMSTSPLHRFPSSVIHCCPLLFATGQSRSEIPQDLQSINTTRQHLCNLSHICGHLQSPAVHYQWNALVFYLLIAL